MKIIGVIPARYKSTRLPGKPLADIHGKPMIWWVYERAKKVIDLDEIIVATDDKRIQDVCRTFHIKSVMTAGQHQTGTDRAGEVARKIDADIYVIIQGDEPLISPVSIAMVIRPFYAGLVCVTSLMVQLNEISDLIDTMVAKVVVNKLNEAIYFSRLPIPYPQDRRDLINYKALGIYAFSREALSKYCGLKRGYVERAENIELLRCIENRIPVQMVEVAQDTISVDVPEDLKRVREIINER